MQLLAAFMPRRQGDAGVAGAPQGRSLPVRVQVLTYAPTFFFHCSQCEIVFHHVGIGQKIHAEQDAAAFPDDLRQEYAGVSDWVRNLVYRFGDRVQVQVVDAASLEGFAKALWYRVRRFPAIVVDGQAAFIGGDFTRADALVTHALAAES